MATDKKEAKIKAKRESLKVLGTGFGSDEPVINKDNYMASLMRALNYYNASFDNKDKRKWVYAYVGKKESHVFDTIESDFEFRSIGTMIRLKQREQYLEQKELDYIDSEIERLKTFSKRVSSLVVEKKKEDKPILSIQDRIKEAANEHIAEFNALFDDFFANDVEPNFAAYLKSNNVSPQVAKLIPPAFVPLWNEMQELLEGKDKQLNEGYDFLKKTKVKKICKLIEEVEAACAQQAVTAKAARKPTVRKIKVKPPAVIAKNVKYLKEFAELNLTSLPAEKIVGATEVVLYNTKTKKIQIYRAIDNGTLTVKGSSIIGYEVATSGMKTMRKPEQVKDFTVLTKRSFAQAFKTLTTKESAVNGRVSQDCIILKVF